MRTADRSELGCLHCTSDPPEPRARAEPHLPHCDTAGSMLPQHRASGGAVHAHDTRGPQSPWRNHSARVWASTASPAAVEPRSPSRRRCPGSSARRSRRSAAHLAEIDLRRRPDLPRPGRHPQFLELTQNPTSGTEMAGVAPAERRAAVVHGLRVERDRLRQGRREGRARRPRDARIDPRKRRRPGTRNAPARLAGDGDRRLAAGAALRHRIESPRPGRSSARAKGTGRSTA